MIEDAAAEEGFDCREVADQVFWDDGPALAPTAALRRSTAARSRSSFGLDRLVVAAAMLLTAVVS